MKIHVQAVDFQADGKLIAFLERKLQRLQRLATDATEAEVRLKLQPNGSRVQEKIAEIRLLMPGNALLDRKRNRTFEAAIDASLDTLRRQLVRLKEKR